MSLVWLGACAPMQKTLTEIHTRQQLAQYRYQLASGFFETVIQQSQAVLKKSETRPPADLALYALGEVYASHAYQGRDYKQSRQYFEKLLLHFPYSPLTSEARTYLGLYDAIDARDRTIAALIEQSSPAAAAERTGSDRPVVENRNFAEATRKNREILAAAGSAPPADEALYNLGLIYAHGENPDKDYRQAREFFNRLSSEFPDSPLAEEARIWLGLFGVFEKMQQIDLEIEAQKKQLNR
ncbi:MAG TPA: tetratricopeptide repeat protein [Desulfurivibrionaceae bacterium]|nr:tetratricopeptide repeat protein [Desulfurivibrionaceae bacterium]